MTTADLILKNAGVITVDPGQPRAELVAIKGDRILAVTGSDNQDSLQGTETRIIDCQGATVTPGFNDAHCHIFSNLRKLLNIDLSPLVVSSIKDIQGIIKRKAQEKPAGQWLAGTDYNDFYLAEKRHPTRQEIDEAALDHPVVLSHRSLHACVLNSLALRMAEITRETPDPPGGYIERDNDGEPTGLLFEMLGYIREKVMPSPTEDELNRGVTMANRQYLEYGITSLQEATVTNSLERWRIYQKFKKDNVLKSRLSIMPGIWNLGQFLGASLKFGAGDDQLRVGGTKIIITEASGKLDIPQEELNRKALEAHRAGFQLAIHAVPESTVEAAIRILEYIDSQSAISERRHRIEHCSECPPHLLERLKNLGTMVVTQPSFIYYSGEKYLATVPVDMQLWLYRTRSFLDSGLAIAGSSDSPVVDNNPLVGIHAAVNRRAETGQELSVGECVSVGQALALYTINAAYASFEEGIKGSITPGKLADLVLLSDDPTSVPPEQIKDIRVLKTIIGGEVAWEA